MPILKRGITVELRYKLNEVITPEVEYWRKTRDEVHDTEGYNYVVIYQETVRSTSTADKQSITKNLLVRKYVMKIQGSDDVGKRKRFECCSGYLSIAKPKMGILQARLEQEVRHKFAVPCLN